MPSEAYREHVYIDTLAMHVPLRVEKVGLGLLFQDDRRGISSTRVISGNFAYRILLSQGILSFGLAAGVSVFRNKWEALVAASKFESYPEYGRATEGRIGIQDHGHEIRYKNIKARPLAGGE